MFASYRKELYSFIVTPYGVVFVSSFLLFSGLTTTLSNLFNQDAHFETTTLAILPWFLLLLLPLLTMRSLADEQVTLPLLYTTATELWEIILGKYLAVLSLVLFVCGLTFIYPIVYDYYSYVHWRNIFSAYLGLFLFVTLYSSIGIWISSLCSSQSGAAILTLLVFLVLLLSGILLPRLPQNTLAQIIILAAFAVWTLWIAWRNGMQWLYLLILGAIFLLILSSLALIQPRFLQGLSGKSGYFISPLNHYQSFTQGLIRIADILYFLSSSTLFILFSILQLEKRRWR